MSTSTFDLDDDVKILKSGRRSYGYYASAESLIVFSQNFQLDFTATGTDCTIKWAVTATGTNYLQASVDGGAFADLTPPGSTNTFTDTTIFTGLSDAAHTVTIKHNAGTRTNSYFQVVGGLSITGASPALSAPASSLYGKKYSASGMDMSRRFIFEGNIIPGLSGNNNVVVFQGPDASVRFRGNPTAIKIWTLQQVGKIRVMQDGAAVGSIVTVATVSGSFGWTTLITGLDGATHDYQIVCCYSSGTVQFGEIALIGGDITDTTLVQRPAILSLGDSKMIGFSATDSTIAYPWLLAQAKGYQSINQGISGQPLTSIVSTAVVTLGNTHPVMQNPSVYANIIKYVLVEIGFNDHTLPDLGSGASSMFRKEYIRLLTRLVDAFPSAKIYCIAPFDTTGYSTTIRDNIATDVSAAVTAVGASNVTYFRGCSSAGQANFTDGWITASGHLADGTHPNALGYADIYNQLIGYIDTAAALNSSGGGSNLLGNGVLVAA